jgi:hypothetical protein
MMSLVAVLSFCAQVTSSSLEYLPWSKIKAFTLVLNYGLYLGSQLRHLPWFSKRTLPWPTIKALPWFSINAFASVLNYHLYPGPQLPWSIIKASILVLNEGLYLGSQ